jgi:hypothetical protein
MNNFMNVKLIGEANDLPCNPTKQNTVIQTKFNKFKLADDSTWDDWKMGIVFPDNEKAQFFIDNYDNQMMDYREGMLKDNYVVHILHFKYPKPAQLYADQISMTNDIITTHSDEDAEAYYLTGWE